MGHDAAEIFGQAGVLQAQAKQRAKAVRRQGT